MPFTKRHSPAPKKEEPKTEPKPEPTKDEKPLPDLHREKEAPIIAGPNFIIHGAYGSKEKAEDKQKGVPGSWIKEKQTKRGNRFIVISKKK